MEKKWFLISAVMHAVVLLALGAASRPVLKQVPTIIEVNLVSTPIAGEHSDREPATASAQPSGSVLKPGQPPGRPMSESTVEHKPDPEGVKPTAKMPGPVATSPVQSPLIGVRPEDEDKPGKTHGPVEKEQVKNPESPIIHEAAIGPDDRIDSREDTDRTAPAHILEDPDQEGISMRDGALLSQRRTSNPKLQTRFFALTGNPSSLDIILSSGTGGGNGTGTGSGMGTGAGTGIGTEPVRPEIISMPEPAYPVLSRRLGEEGKVVVQVKIGAQGSVLRAEVIESSSYPRLDRAALQAVRKASFHPATKAGVPVDSDSTVAYRFELEDE